MGLYDSFELQDGEPLHRSRDNYPVSRRSSQGNRAAKRRKANVLLLEFCHGLENHELLLDDGKKTNAFGFFRYALKEGVMEDWCIGIAADELRKGSRLSIRATEHDGV